MLMRKMSALASKRRLTKSLGSIAAGVRMHPATTTTLNTQHLEAAQGNFSKGTTTFDQLMRPLEIGRVDRAEVLCERRADRPLIDQAGHLVQQIALLRDIGRAEHRAREHQLPMHRDALALERIEVERRGVIDQREAALRRDQFDDLRKMLVRVRRGEDKGRLSDSKSSDLLSQRL